MVCAVHASRVIRDEDRIYQGKHGQVHAEMTFPRRLNGMAWHGMAWHGLVRRCGNSGRLGGRDIFTFSLHLPIWKSLLPAETQWT